MRIVFVPIFFFLTVVLNAQTNTYLADLTALKSIVEKTASFKAQTKGAKLYNYNDLYNRLALDTTNNPNSYKYFYNLAQLLFSLRDNHLGFYQLPNYDHFKTKEALTALLKQKNSLIIQPVKSILIL